jgi:glycosyltransferase involved in cell wall biosynthesis
VEAWGELRPRLRSALCAADQIWCVSRYTRDRVGAEQGVPETQLGVLPNTFESDRFRPGEKSRELLARYHLPGDAKVIFTFGRLAASERYKGFDRIIAALPEIRRHVLDVYYLIGGTGDDRPRLESLARANGMADRVIFTDFIRSEELCAHYNLCDVFAMPSTGEGFGIVYLEAMACGRPVLAGNRDGSTEPLRDGAFGALVDPHDNEQIVGTLTQILQRRYAHPLMFKPERLREEIVRAFGFAPFCSKLATNLRRVLPASSILG